MKISVIVPVYNAEQYLPQCLESILNQTYSDLEIICVNDGSSDHSLAVLQAYAARDSRIHIIDRENAGVSQARNDGLKAADGEALLFVDADDWIDLDTCRQAVNAMQTQQADIVLWSYVSENRGSQSCKKIFGGDITFDETQCKNLLHRRFAGICGLELAHPELADSLCPVWGKLYRTDVIRESRAQFIDLAEIGTYEDGFFNLEVFGSVKKAFYMDHCFYHYRRDNAGSVTSGYRPKLYAQWQNLFDRIQQYIVQNHLPQEYSDALDNRIALSILGLGMNVLNADMSFRGKIKLLGDMIRRPRYRSACGKLDFQFFPVHWKLFYACSKYRCTVGLYFLLAVIRKIIH